MPREILGILTNREALAINQDPLGRQGKRVCRDDNTEVWVRPLKNGDIALAVFSLAGQARDTKLAWTALALEQPPKSARDLWAHKDLPNPLNEFSAHLAGHAVAMLRIKP